MCLEAAFHFPDRHQFLDEAFRVLRPGGRLLVVDFAWNSDGDRTHLEDPEMRLVRDVWQWDDMSSIAEYARFGRETGFKLFSTHDWSNRVTGPTQSQFYCLSLLGKSRWGRRLLQWRNPLYRSLSREDWKSLARAVRAHEHARLYSKYMAFLFEKP
jgi:ubiquinone/menaquinone biosynthesis C-methylase UbiE